jgi:hypothetical protein
MMFGMQIIGIITEIDGQIEHGMLPNLLPTYKEKGL